MDGGRGLTNTARRLLLGIFASAMLLVPAAAFGYTGNCAIWAHKTGNFTSKFHNGNQAGFDDAKSFVGTNGTIWIYPGCDGQITLGTLSDSVLVMQYQSGSWVQAGARATMTFPRLGPASSAASGGAIRIMDGVTFAQTGAGLSAAISDLPTAGGTIIAPQGEYSFSVAVTYTGTGAIKIVGGGPGVTVFKQANSANIGTGLLVFGGLAGANEVANVSVSGITFDGNRANNTTNFSALFMRNVAGADVENCEFQNSTDIGLGIGDGSDANTSSFYVRVRSCYAHNNEGNGFDMANSAFGIFTGNVARFNGGVGFFCGHGITYDHLYSNNLSEANGNDGFQVTVGTGDTVAKRIVYHGNIARADSLNGFRAVSSLAGKQINNVMYIGNEAYSNGVAGTANAQNGFLLDGADVTQCVVTGNRALADDGTTTQKYGVMTRNSATNNVISNNSLEANNTGATSLVGTNQVYGNKTTASSEEFPIVGYATVSDSLRTNKGLYVGGQFVNKILRASAALDFDLTAVTCQDLTITVTGAALNDEVSLGVPAGAVTTDATYYAWVSAANTVTVRACDGALAGNPASGTFKVTVVQ